MLQTAFGSAFAKAGVDMDAARLAVAATNALQRSGGDVGRALGRFVEMIENDRGLRRAIVQAYLQDRAEDMRGESLRRGDQSSSSREAQISGIPASHPNDGGAAQHEDSKKPDARLATPPSPNDETLAHAMRSNTLLKRPLADVSSPQAGAAQVLSSSAELNHLAAAPAPRKPNGIDVILRARAGTYTVLDTFKVRDGKLDAYRAETHGTIRPDDPGFTGHFIGYQADAAEMIARLAVRGFRLQPAWQPIATAPFQTNILVCQASDAAGRMIPVEAFTEVCQVARRELAQGGDPHWIIPNAWFPVDPLVPFNPTHWRPLGDNPMDVIGDIVAATRYFPA